MRGGKPEEQGEKSIGREASVNACRMPDVLHFATFSLPGISMTSRRVVAASLLISKAMSQGNDTAPDTSHPSHDAIPAIKLLPTVLATVIIRYRTRTHPMPILSPTASLSAIPPRAHIHFSPTSHSPLISPFLAVSAYPPHTHTHTHTYT